MRLDEAQIFEVAEFVEDSLKRADEALRGAKILFEKDEFHGVVSKGYAVFHAANALVYSRGHTKGITGYLFMSAAPRL